MGNCYPRGGFEVRLARVPNVTQVTQVTQVKQVTQVTQVTLMYAGHMLHHDHPLTLARHLEAFLQGA